MISAREGDGTRNEWDNEWQAQVLDRISRDSGLSVHFRSVVPQRPASLGRTVWY